MVKAEAVTAMVVLAIEPLFWLPASCIVGDFIQNSSIDEHGAFYSVEKRIEDEGVFDGMYRVFVTGVSQGVLSESTIPYTSLAESLFACEWHHATGKWE